MRSGGGCTVHHALTPDAAAVVKQALVLAHRRGHAQVTPLHVANTMLAASGGLFRIACLKSKSHSHPLQCKALELCFNVALNRLPASSSGPILGPHPNPSISNALVAAFKRAQAHQRRGSIENQQQPILAVKIELEQLVISILDDPSVSRVMREAGFSSTHVKSNVENEVSLEITSSANKSKSDEEKLTTSSPTNPELHNSNNSQNSEITIRAEDVDIIIETLLTCSSRRSRSLAIVGESISNLQATVKGVTDRIDKGEAPEALKEVKFISIPPLYSFCNLHREEVEQKIGELTCLVKSLVEKGVVLYLGDLKWISDYRVQERGFYCSVEHMMMEIGTLIWGIGEVGRFWLMGIATFQTYMRCRNSLETVWGLHPVTIPANSLGLSLSSQSDRREKSRLPSWLKDECSRRFSDNDQNVESVDGTLRLSSSVSCSPLRNHQQNPNFQELGANSTSSSDVIMEMDYVPKFKEFNAENLKILCNELEKKFPWQREIVQEIAGTVLKSRSGMLKRKKGDANGGNDVKEETWMLFLGPDDAQAKEKISMELARIVFGSYSSFISIGSNGFGSNDECRRKRGRDEQSCTSYVDRFAQAVFANPHRVFFMEDMDQVDYCSKLGIKRAIERGRIGNGNCGEEIGLMDAIIVLSCEEFGSRSRGDGVAGAGEDETTTTTMMMNRGSLDLNVSFDGEMVEDRTADDLGILESVDQHVVFKIHL